MQGAQRHISIYALVNRLRVLVEKVESISTANEEEKAYVKEYLEVNFNMQAKEEPVLYAQGFSDAIRFLKYFEIL